MKILVRSFAVAAVVCGLAAGVGTSQHTTPNQLPSGVSSMPDAGMPIANRTDAASRQLELRQAKLRNDERQKRLVADTDKLLTLATELHADVAKTDKNILSLDVIKRADEIERLAHSVKDRMRD